MMVPDIVHVIERQAWLDPLADRVLGVLKGAQAAAGPRGQTVVNGLYGTWLRHPLHPMLTDIPIGAWSVALVLDALDAREGGRRADSDGDGMAHAADAAIAVGLLGALGSAASGPSDWQHEYGKTVRIGLAHGLLNVGATSLYGVSLLLRARGSRGAARCCALAGYGLLATAGYIGGELVFRDRLGVDTTAGLEPPTDFTPALDDSALAEGTMQRVRIKGVPILLARQHGDIYALVERCTHRGGPLSEGTLEDGCVVCPWHGSRFALADGRVIDGPATFPQPSLETRVREGKIELRVPPGA